MRPLPLQTRYAVPWHNHYSGRRPAEACSTHPSLLPPLRSGLLWVGVAFPETLYAMQCLDLSLRRLVAPQYGQRWSRFLPLLGSDRTCRTDMAVAEELLAVLRNMADIIAAEQSLLFGPYTLPHRSALSPEGLACFLSSVPAMQGALEFCGGALSSPTLALPLQRHTQSPSACHCSRCSAWKWPHVSFCCPST